MLAGDAVFRWLVPLILLANLAVSATYRARARRMEVIERRSESRGLILARLGIGLPTMVLLVVFVIAPRAIPWSRLPLTGSWIGLRWFGVAMGVGAVPLVWWTLSNLGTNVSETVLTKDSHQLVTSGPYQWVRHPLYAAGGLLLLPGLGLVTASWVLLALNVVIVGTIRWGIVPREEAALEEKFEEAYRAYRATTGALLPRWL
ncbi:MAG: isoprenylcysteine carboxylmethyltransferase family protein [Acidobacteriota bacterium]|nr:isoprenylcysteine carboxylmethyltransferase family protein [Acidobacteriota bacterium]